MMLRSIARRCIAPSPAKSRDHSGEFGSASSRARHAQFFGSGEFSEMVMYSLGVDGGGSKTDCVILRPGRENIGDGAAGPSNPLRVGFPAAFENVRTAATLAMAEADLVPPQITA